MQEQEMNYLLQYVKDKDETRCVLKYISLNVRQNTLT